MAGIRHTTPADGTFTTEGASAWNGDEAHTLSDVASQTDLNALSNAVSVLSNTNSSEHAGLSNRITSVAGLGGGSVTSAEVQAVSAAAQSAVNTVSAAVNVVSNATSAEIVNRVSADNALSANIASVDGRATSIANALSALSNANSASHVSIDGRVTSVANAVSALSQALSVLSNTNSAAHVSIDGRVTSVANAVSVVSNALSVLSQTNSVDHAALSNRITSVAGLAGGGSVTSNELSAAIAGQSSRTDSVYNAVSALIDRVSANSGTGGAGSVTSTELSAAVQGLSLRVDSAVAANANNASVASNAASVALAAQHVASNYASVTSNYASAVSNYASVVSNYASVISATALTFLSPKVLKVQNTQSTAGSALVDISGLALTVAAGETWEVEGLLMLSTSAATVGLKVGTSVPVLSLPRFIEFTRLSAGQSAGIIGGGGLMQVSGTSQFLSAANAGGVIFGVRYAGVFNVASAGTFRIMYGGTASTAASPVHIMQGSYMKAIKI